MTFKNPPRLATWLLNHLGGGPNNEAALGDLAERYRQGRTNGWYRKQVLQVIAISAFNDILAHKLLALRAVLSGLFVMVCIVFLGSTLVTNWNPALWAQSEILARGIEFTEACLGSIVLGMVPGWVAFRLYGRQRAILSVYFLVVQALAVFTSLTAPEFRPAYSATIMVSLTLGILIAASWTGPREERFE